MRYAFAMVVAAAASATFDAPAAQERFPERPIRYILHVSPGGATDIMARKLAIPLEKVLGVAVPVENKAGGRGAAQIADLVAAKPDGHTIASITSSHIGAFNQTLTRYQIDSFDWIARLVNEPFIVAVRNDSPLKSFKDVVDAANAKPGSVVMAGFVRGSGGHFAWEIMAKGAGLDSKKVRWVPYDSVGDAVTSVLGGHSQVAIAYVDLVKAHVAAGNMRVIGVMAEERVPQFPSAPTLKEQGYAVDNSWQQMRGIIAPKGLPDAVKSRLSSAIREAMESADFKSYMNEASLVPAFQGPSDFLAFARQQDAVTKQWMDTLGIKR